ncbi:CD84 molecule [Chelydra serpentina]|uniref:CD84 molecule n=1 Tax=Chelydra serpentina TaxID=8475 RepID=A0A8T1RVY5_CHESE|nr:CD84 molecule [Chelydra serpentina]
MLVRTCSDFFVRLVFSHLGFFSPPLVEQVPEPTILCDSVTCVNETCNYTLSCTVRDGGDNVTYSWTHPAGGAAVPNESIVHISQRPRDAHLNVTCTARNPASNSSTTVSTKELCAGKSFCRKDSCLKQKQSMNVYRS